MTFAVGMLFVVLIFKNGYKAVAKLTYAGFMSNSISKIRSIMTI